MDDLKWVAKSKGDLERRGGGLVAVGSQSSQNMYQIIVVDAEPLMLRLTKVVGNVVSLECRGGRLWREGVDDDDDVVVAVVAVTAVVGGEWGGRQF